MQENVELQREVEVLRAKLEYTFTFINDKLDQQQETTSTNKKIATRKQPTRSASKKRK